MKYPTRNIVWIASYPKSGNTWFRIVLANLLSDQDELIDINDIKRTLNASSRNLIDEYSGVSCSDLTMNEIDEIRPQVYGQIAEESNDLVFFKVHEAWKKTESGVPLFPSEYTKAVIYIIRNPLDIAISFAFHSMVSIENTVERLNDPEYSFCSKTDRLVGQVKQVLTDWTSHVSSWIDKSGLPVKILRYEDMLNDPYNIFKNAFDFIGIEKSNNEIANAIKQSDFERLGKFESEYGFEEKPILMKKFFRSGKSGIWKDQLSPELVRNIVKQQHGMMDRFGYLDSYIADLI